MLGITTQYNIQNASAENSIAVFVDILFVDARENY